MPKAPQEYPKVFIRPQAVRGVENGSPWCYRDAIERTDEGLEDGSLCAIHSGQSLCATGYYHGASDIAVRILARGRAAVDTDFFIRKLRILKEEKEQFLEDTNAYRLVNGEGDGMPGLIVDVYDRSAVVQILTLGMEKLKPQVVNALISVLKPSQIYERSHSGLRAREGLPAESSGLLYGKEKARVDIVENGFRFRVDIAEGQKTGFFLDQRENRKALVRYCKEKSVLNCFSYTGGFSVYAASVARMVTSVDISKPAIEAAKVNFELNGFDPKLHGFEAVDVLDYLKSIEKGEYHVIILDPPSFAKNKDQFDAAIKAYTTINAKALEKLPDYGILVAASCSSRVDDTAFVSMLRQAGALTHCAVKVLECKTQPPDHTYSLTFPEGRYLKFYVLQKWPL